MSIEKLHNALVDQDLLSIGFDEFQNKLQNDNYKSKVYGAIIDQDLYSGDFDTFNKQFFSEIDSLDNQELDSIENLSQQERQELSDEAFSIQDRTTESGKIVKGTRLSAAAADFGPEEALNFAYKKLKGFASGGLRLVDDIVDLAEFSGKMNNPTARAIYFAQQAAIRSSDATAEEKQKIQRLAKENDMFNIVDLDPIAESIEKTLPEYKNDKGEKLDFLGLIGEKRYLEAADSFTTEAATALPSLLISMVPGGYAALGGSSALNKYEKDIITRNDQSVAKIVGNSIVFGGADAVGEWIGGRYLRNLARPLIGKKTKGVPSTVKDAVVGGVGGIIKTGFKGGSVEFMQEAITSVIQDAGDGVIYGDEKELAQVGRNALHSGLIGFALGKSAGTVSGTMNKVNKSKFYEYLAPKSYKVDQMKLSEAQEKAEQDLENAPKSKKEKFQKVVDNIKAKKQKLKDQLYDRFETMQREDPKEMELLLEKIQEQHEALDIINGGDKYSNEAKEQAKKDFKEAADIVGDLMAVTDVNYDSEIELELSKYIRAAEEIDEANKSLWFKSKDLKYEYVNTQEKFDELKKQYGDKIANQADGFFDVTEDGQKKIFINREVAAASSATNVIGHELLHYALSNRFANDPKYLRDSVIAFNQYLDNLPENKGSYIRKSIEKRLSNPKNGYAKLDANGKVQRDSDGLIVMKKESYIEEYFTMFSDLIKKEKIDVVENASKGLANTLRTTIRGLGLGFNNVDFKNGQEVFDFLIDYNKNLGRKGILGAITQRKAIKQAAGKGVKKAETKQEKQRYKDSAIGVKTEEFTVTQDNGTTVKYKAKTYLDGSVKFDIWKNNSWRPAAIKSIKPGEKITSKEAIQQVYDNVSGTNTVKLDKTEGSESLTSDKKFNRLTTDQQQRVDPTRAKQTKKSVTVKKSMSAPQKAKVEEAVDKLGQVDTDGNNLREKGTGNFYYQADVDNIIKELRKKRTDKNLGLENEAYLDNLIAAKYKVRPVPKAFVSDVFNQLLPDIKGFKPEENNSLFGYLGPRITFRAGDVYKEIYEKKGPATVPTEAKTKEEEVKVQVKAEKDVAMEELETKDIGIAAQIQERQAEKEGKKEVERQSKFRNTVGFKTGSQIYNEVLDAAKKSLIRAYAKTRNIKDVAARERAVVAEIQKEHNSLTSPLFKQIKNWLSYGKAQEVVTKGTKDIYLDNLREFREDITKLISTADLVQIERLVNESDRVFTRFKGQLTRKADVEQAVNEGRLPPDAIRKYDKDKKVNEYDKVIPGETEIVEFADQPGSVPSKKDPTKMVRSGLKGTRKDGITKNIVNGLVLDAVMEARQSKDVQDKISEMDIDATSVQELSAAAGRPVDVKFSISMGNMSNIISDIIVDKKKHARDFGKGDRQRRFAVTAISDIIRNIDNEGVYSSLVPLFEDLKNNINLGLTFDEVINSTWNKHGYLFKDVASYQMNVEMFNGSLNKKHLTNLLGKAKRITEVQVNQIAFNDAIKDLQKNPTDANIKKFLRQYSKQIRTAKFVYNGKTITKNIHVLDNIVKPIQKNNNFDIKTVSKGKQRITFKGEELFTYQNSTEVKEAFKNNDQEAIQKIIETYQKESKEAIDFVEATLKSDKSIEVKKAIIKSFFADTDAGGRKIAKPGIMAFGVSKTVLDHRVPINKVIQEIYKTADNSTSQNLKNLREFLENTRVNNIPKTVDTKLVELGFKTEGSMDVMNNPEVLKLMEGVETKNYSNIKQSRSTKSESFNKAVMFSRSTNNPTKGITVLDFDDTLATTKSLVKFTRPDGTTGTLNAEQYASTYEDLLEQGYKFDFSEFNKVVKGKLAPLFQKALKLQKKFGPKNMFVLTARPPAAQQAIFDFLKANGLNIPLENITGLGNSTAEAKALWIADKVGEGYNDFYFADDALQNVQAVKNMLKQFDVKSKVQQAKVKFSQSMDNDFNKILEDVTGIESKKRFSEIKARKRGASKGKFRLFIPPSHEDFVGLLYNFMGKGRKGDQHRNFFEQALVKPLNRAYKEIDTAKQAIANDYKSLNKQFPEVKKKLTKETLDGDFTFQDAIRVYLWNKHGYDIPGLTKTDQAKLVELVMNDADLVQYAETLNVISKQDTYVDPGPSWETGNIRIDLIDATGRVGRAQYFTEFNENAETIFSPENLNKIEAAYGKDFREALEDMLHAIKTGINRPKGANAKPNMFLNWLNASVSGVMFFNTRSSILQQMSIVNYINFADNNMYAAAKAFANQLQYWKDWAFIFNSDMLKQRRGGIGTDINGAELAEAVKKARPNNLFDQVAIITGKLLKLGFLPTQIGDNIAIATGGATFYRNRINKYIKDGMSKKEAEAAAFTDFQNLTQSTQQSSRPDMTSQQQRSWIGKFILNFQNITSQYNRIIKKAALDVMKGRISPPYTTKAQSNLGNLSKILYYGGIQNVLFYSLQTALFAVMFDDDEDEDQILKKKERVIQGTIDSILRGSGIYGAVASTLKNMVIKFNEQREKGYNKDESAVLMEALNLSPIVGIRARGIVNAEKTLNYNTKVIKEMETFDIDNPMWSAVTNYVQVAGFPANRLYQKSINMRNALNTDYTNFQRALFFSGYTTWSLGLGDSEAVIEAKEKIKINKANAKKRKKSKKFKTFKFK